MAWEGAGLFSRRVVIAGVSIALIILLLMKLQRLLGLLCVVRMLLITLRFPLRLVV